MKRKKNKVKVPPIHHDVMTTSNISLFSQITKIENIPNYDNSKFMTLTYHPDSFKNQQATEENLVSRHATGNLYFNDEDRRTPEEITKDESCIGHGFPHLHQRWPSHLVGPSLKNAPHWRVGTSKALSSASYAERTGQVPHRYHGTEEDFRVGIADTFGVLAFSMLGYRKFGQNTYVVGPAMQQMLANTNLGDVTYEDVKLPFPTIYLALQDSPWKLWGDSYTRWHECNGIYVSFNSIFEVKHCLTVVLWGKANEQSMGVDDDATFFYTLNLSTLEQRMFDRRVTGDVEDEMEDMRDVFRATSEEEILSIEGLLNQVFEASPISDSEAKRMGMTPKEAAHYLLQMVEINRFVVNFLLYLTAENADLTDVPDRHKHTRTQLERKLGKYKHRNNKNQEEKVQHKLDALPKTKITYIGKRVERTYAAKPMRHRSTGRKTRIQGRKWRQGYWNHYWVGSKMDEDGNPRKGERRVRKWVEAYEINKDMALLYTKHIHKVVEPRKKRKRA